MGCSVLLVDDQETFLEFAHKLLKAQRGITVVGKATTAKEAVSLQLQFKPEVAIVDFQMPQVADGLETARLMLQRDPELIVIMTSSTCEEGYESLSRLVGAVAFLEKARLSAATILQVTRSCRVPVAAESGSVVVGQ